MTGQDTDSLLEEAIEGFLNQEIADSMAAYKNEIKLLLSDKNKMKNILDMIYTRIDQLQQVFVGECNVQVFVGECSVFDVHLYAEEARKNQIKEELQFLQKQLIPLIKESD